MGKSHKGSEPRIRFILAIKRHEPELPLVDGVNESGTIFPEALADRSHLPQLQILEIDVPVD